MWFRVVPGLTAKLGTWIERARVQRERPLWAKESWEGLRDEPGWAGQGLERRGLPGGEDALASPPLLRSPPQPTQLFSPFPLLTSLMPTVSYLLLSPLPVRPPLPP